MPTTDSSLVSALLVNLSNKKMYDARMFATIKLLEYIEDQLKEITGVVSSKLLAQDPDWSKLFDKKFVRFGGFERARYLPQAGDFDIELWEAGQRAKNIAQLVDFSLRFEPNPKKPKQIGGITMAKAIAVESEYFNVKCDQRTLQTHWKQFEPVAAFLPLISLKKYPAWPLCVSKTKFVNKLLARLDDRDTLLSFFAEYNANVSRLQSRGYHVQSLAGLPTADVKFDPLPEKVKEHIKHYRS